MTAQLTQAPRGSRPAPSRHGPIAQLLIAWSPLSTILVVYAVTEWVNAPLSGGDPGSTNRLGRGLHVAEPARLDRVPFGTNPSAWLQAHLLGAAPHWYDALAALVYVTHVVAIPAVTALVWFRMRDRFAGWLVAVVAFTTVGEGGYVVYPAAPPWWAAEHGDLSHVVRSSDRGWTELHLDWVGRLVGAAQDRSDPVAAMPSLHAGGALLVTLFLWPVVSAGWRAALLAYVLLMAGTLVYTGEHYVSDVLAGWVVAGLAVAVTLVRPRGLWPSPGAELRPPTMGDATGDGPQPAGGGGS